MKRTSTQRLNTAVEGLRQIDHRARALLNRVDQATLNQPPATGGWTAGQCLEHLTNTNRQYIRVLTEGLQRGEREGIRGDAPFEHNLFERFFIWSMEPPVKFKTKAPSMIARVTPVLNLAEITAEYFGVHGELVTLIERARGLDLKRVVITSPFSGRMHFNMGAAIETMLAHERRHLLQAEKAAGLDGVR